LNVRGRLPNGSRYIMIPPLQQNTVLTPSQRERRERELERVEREKKAREKLEVRCDSHNTV